MANSHHEIGVHTVYYWRCPACGWRWTIFSEQRQYFPVACLNCRKHEVTWEEVENCPHEKQYHAIDEFEVNMNPHLPNPGDLRHTTADAVRRGKERERRRLAEIKEKEEKQKQADELFAERVLLQVPGKCETEAEAGRSHAIVMSLKYGRDHDQTSNKLTYNQLKGPGAIVWNALQEAKLNPTLEYWWDYETSGFNIVVHW